MTKCSKYNPTYNAKVPQNTHVVATTRMKTMVKTMTNRPTKPKTAPSPKNSLDTGSSKPSSLEMVVAVEEDMGWRSEEWVERVGWWKIGVFSFE